MPRGRDIDEKIKDQLRADPKLSESALAAKVGVDRNTCHKHLVNLIEDGEIEDRQYRVVEGRNPKTMGYILIKAPQSPERGISNLIAILQENSSCLAFAYVTGDYDIVVELHESLHSKVVGHLILRLRDDGADTLTLGILNHS